MGDKVLLERRDNGVAVLTLNNPKVNALSSAVLADLHAAVEVLAADLPGAVVVTGGDRIFAAGADITEFAGPDEAQVISANFTRAFGALAELPRFVVAAISGYALGGGCELALACDYRIASTKAVFGQPEVLLGIIPGAGGTQRLARAVGPSRAKELCITGRQVPAEEALRIGLANEVVAPEALMERVLELAAEVARGAVVAQAAMKHAVNAGLDGSLADGLALEQRLFIDVFASDDAKIGVESFVANGPGKATFTGR